jgi:hypothetical protein
VQGGAILAAMGILAWMAGLAQPPRVGSLRLRAWLVAGPAVVLAIGAVGVLLAEGGFLGSPGGFATLTVVVAGAALTVTIAVAFAALVLGPSEGGEA